MPNVLEAGAKQSGEVAGKAAGAAAGAALGTLIPIPGLGTVAGGLIGSTVGPLVAKGISTIGNAIGSGLKSLFTKKKKVRKGPPPSVAATLPIVHSVPAKTKTEIGNTVLTTEGEIGRENKNPARLEALAQTSDLLLAKLYQYRKVHGKFTAADDKVFKGWEGRLIAGSKAARTKAAAIHKALPETQKAKLQTAISKLAIERRALINREEKANRAAEKIEKAVQKSKDGTLSASNKPLLAGAGSGAALGFVFGGPIGAAVGAAIGVYGGNAYSQSRLPKV